MTKRQNQADLEAARLRQTEQTLAPHTKRASILTLIVCGAVVLSLGFALCFCPHEEFSPTEKRPLAGVPTLSFESLLEGELSQEVSDFCADQFPLRAQLIQAKAAVELLLGKQQNNGVLLGKQGHLFVRAEYTDEDSVALDQNLRSVRAFERSLSEQGMPFLFAIAPRSIDVTTHMLPAHYDTANADAVWSWIADTERLQHHTLTAPLQKAAWGGERVWYKTDHHWTALGAYYAYAALGDLLGYTPYPLSDFEQVTVCDDFRGSAYASSGMHWMEGEPITLLRYQGDDQFLTRIIESGKEDQTIQGLYDLSALQTNDQYNVFLGGTNTRIEVTMPGVGNRPVLMIIKDSFAQSLAPFLARHYDLLLIDPRTYKSGEQTLYELIAEQQPDRVLVLCGVQTLCETGALKALYFTQK